MTEFRGTDLWVKEQIEKSEALHLRTIARLSQLEDEGLRKSDDSLEAFYQKVFVSLMSDDEFEYYRQKLKKEES